MLQRHAILALALILLTACGNGVEVTRSEYGEDWPFTVKEGVVKCLSDNSVIFVADGVEYGLNGFAMGRGYAALERIWLIDEGFHYDMAEGVSKAKGVTLAEAYEMLGPPTTRISIGPILDLGLSLS